MSRRNTVVKNEFPLMEETKHIYAKDMKENVRYSFRVSCSTVVLQNGVYYYRGVCGDEFIGQPSPYSLVREYKS